ncbi:MAG: hypothetical protein JWQ11_4888 [Rhizobacter sp.]|nr:hypothetical protein [Rhizobacter sp.]
MIGGTSERASSDDKFDGLRRQPVLKGRSALLERRLNDGLQLRIGDDCLEVRNSRQAALDPFSAADRPGARGVQRCD